MKRYRSLFVDYALSKLKERATWFNKGKELAISNIPLLQVKPLHWAPIGRYFLVVLFLLVAFNLVFFLVGHFHFLRRTFL